MPKTKADERSLNYLYLLRNRRNRICGWWCAEGRHDYAEEGDELKLFGRVTAQECGLSSEGLA